MNKTALYNLHKKFNAKFVSFAGYEMPIQYKDGIIAEHNLTREKSGIFDVSHMGQLFIVGDDKLTDKLQDIFPTDLKNLSVNQSRYSFLMNENAGIYDDLIITKISNGYMIILNAACKEKDFEIIKSKLGEDFKISLSKDLSLVAVQGPDSKNLIEKIIPGVNKLKFMFGGDFKFNSNNIYVTRSGYTGEDGFEISINNSDVVKFVETLISLGSNLIGLGARDTLRLEAGLCLYGNDIDENTSPLEANLKWAISKKRRETGGFKGWENIKKDLQNGVSKIRVGIKPVGKIIAREGTKIFSQTGQEIGVITSGTYGPSVNSPVAMGYVKSKFSEIDKKILIEVRGKKYEATVSKLPFYKKSYVK